MEDPPRRTLASARRGALAALASRRAIFALLAAPLAVLLFIFALRLLVAGATTLTDLLDVLNAGGMVNLIGLGWIGSYLVLSGSPIAATALTLLDTGVLTETEAFAQIVGSRVGASFVVLAVGFLYYLRGQRLPDSVHVGVVAFLVTVTTWIPVALLGAAALHWGWFDGISIGAVSPLATLNNDVFGPPIDDLRDALPDAVIFIAGLALLLGAFKLFDSVLPTPERTSDYIARLPAVVHTRWAMFAIGAAVTLVTFSVAVSLTLLVPLSLRGAIRRDAIVAYVLGANVTTFADTLFAASALESGATGTVVVTTIFFALAVALVVLAVLYRPYLAAIHWAARRITQDRRGLTWFIAAIVAFPVLLTLV